MDKASICSAILSINNCWFLIPKLESFIASYINFISDSSRPSEKVFSIVSTGDSILVTKEAFSKISPKKVLDFGDNFN